MLEDLLILFCGMALMAIGATILAAVGDWLQKRLDEFNEYNDNNLNNAEQ